MTSLAKMTFQSKIGYWHLKQKEVKLFAQREPFAIMLLVGRASAKFSMKRHFQQLSITVSQSEDIS